MTAVAPELTVCIWISPGRLPRKPAHRTFGGYRFRLCVRMCSSCQTSDGSGGRRDDYGSALSAQPGESQRRPPTNTSSQPIQCSGLPAPSCSRCLCPGWSRRTLRSSEPQPDVGTENLIRLPIRSSPSGENKQRTEVVGIFPKDDAIVRPSAHCSWSRRTSGRGSAPAT